MNWSDYLRWYGLVEGRALVGHLDDYDEVVLEWIAESQLAAYFTAHPAEETLKNVGPDD